VVIQSQRCADVRQEHDEYYKSELDDSGRSVDEEALLQMLYKGRLEYKMEVRGLEAYKSTQQIQGLYAVLFLDK
jgi:hypothetical protein